MMMTKGEDDFQYAGPYSPPPGFVLEPMDEGEQEEED